MGELKHWENAFELGKKYISKLEVSDFTNFPIKPEFLEATWHYLDEKTNKFHYEEHLPQATYTLEATDERWIEHLYEGQVWETTSCDLDGPSWYLEYKSEKSNKFYRIFQTDMGRWQINYGKLGTPGRTDQPQYMSVYGAEMKVKEKTAKSKGYQLIYKNFDTPFDIEKKMEREAEKEAKKEAQPGDGPALFKAIEKEDIAGLTKILATGLDSNTCQDKYDRYPLQIVADAWNPNENHLTMARILLEAGADPNLGNYGPFFPSVVLFKPK